MAWLVKGLKEVDRMEGQCEGRLNGTSPPKTHNSDEIPEHNDSSITQEIARSLLSANTSHDLFPYVSRTVEYFPINLVWI